MLLLAHVDVRNSFTFSQLAIVEAVRNVTANKTHNSVPNKKTIGCLRSGKTALFYEGCESAKSPSPSPDLAHTGPIKQI